MEISNNKFGWVKILLYYYIIRLLIRIFDFYFMSLPNLQKYIENNKFFTESFGSNILWTYYEIVPLIIPIAVVLLFNYFILHKKLVSIGFVKNKCCKNILMGIVIGFVLFTLCMIFAIIFRGVSITGISKSADFTGLLVYFVGFLIQGMEEEVLYRGFLYQSLKEKSSISFAVILSSLLFSISHCNNNGFEFLAFINLFLFGVVAALIYQKYKNIWMVAAFHGTWNFVQGNIYGIHVSGNEFDYMLFDTTIKANKSIINGGSFGLEGGIGVTVIMLCAVALIIYLDYSHYMDRSITGRRKVC